MKKSFYLIFAFTFSTIAAMALLVEFLLLPYVLGLPRDTLLMGFSATPGETVDGQTINAMGFSGDVIDKEKPPDTIRVLMLGGSVLFNRNFTARLQQQLNAPTTNNIEVVNAALRSHTTQSSLRKMRLLAEYEFDYVFIYHGINDLWANHVQSEDFDTHYAHLGPHYRQHPFLNHSLIARYLYLGSAPWINAALTHLKLKPAYRFVFPEKTHRNAAAFASIESFAHNINEITSLAQAHGTTPILMTFAFAIPEGYSRKKFIAGEAGYTNPENYDRREINNWGPPAFVETGLTLTNERLRTIAQTRRIPLLDIDAVMSQDLQWFGDVCHFNHQGVDELLRHITSQFNTLTTEQNARAH